MSDPKFPDKNNLVSVVRVGPGYHQRAVGSAVTQWYIFNDLGVTPVSAEEAVWLPLQWKVRGVGWGGGRGASLGWCWVILLVGKLRKLLVCLSWLVFLSGIDTGFPKTDNEAWRL